MKNKLSYCLFIVLGFGCVASSCVHKSIPLCIVRNTPDYFRNDIRFGENIKSMQEKNAFIAATGSIDTTNEHAPIEVAFICIENHLLQLEFIEKTRNGDKITNAYYGNGFALLVSYTIHGFDSQGNIYKNAHIRIGRKNDYSEYEAFGQLGYL
jgi:hypothetical protein